MYSRIFLCCASDAGWIYIGYTNTVPLGIRSLRQFVSIVHRRLPPLPDCAFSLWLLQLVLLQFLHCELSGSPCNLRRNILTSRRKSLPSYPRFSVHDQSTSVASPILHSCKRKSLSYHRGSDQHRLARVYSYKLNRGWWCLTLQIPVYLRHVHTCISFCAGPAKPRYTSGIYLSRSRVSDINRAICTGLIIEREDLSFFFFKKNVANNIRQQVLIWDILHSLYAEFKLFLKYRFTVSTVAYLVTR